MEYRLALKRFWLLFAQAATVALAVVLVIGAIQPGWLPWRRGGVVASLAGDDGRSGSVVSYAEAARHATPSVVNIYTSSKAATSPMADDPAFRKFFGDEGDNPREGGPSLGSGVIVSEKGFVLTNNHVVESADEIEVALADGRKANAIVVGTDPDTDLAVLRIELPDLPTMKFGQIDQLHVGDVVLAIGNPFGFGSSVTMGIVSAIGRSHLGINTFENFIQTDASINPGNSGGALVDTQGNLLGINAAILSRSGTSAGIGFAIPADTARQVLDSIVATGQVVRGYIGVETQDVTPELAGAFALPRQDGAIIAGVVRGGPAERAGVRTGDILFAVNGRPVTDSNAMLNLISQLAPGTKAQLSLLRDKQERQIGVDVGRRPKPAGQH
jgi:serine protease DegQ